jgi:hypothetical protein
MPTSKCCEWRRARGDVAQGAKRKAQGNRPASGYPCALHPALRTPYPSCRYFILAMIASPNPEHDTSLTPLRPSAFISRARS